MNTFMLTGSASEYTKKMMKKFSKMWEGNTFSSDKKSSIIDLSNKMLKDRKRPTHFESLLHVIKIQNELVFFYLSTFCWINQ